MPSSSQKFWNSAAVKFVPLSVMMLCGTPNLKMIDLRKLTVVRVVELVMGTASIHLVTLSTATSRCVLLPFDDLLSGPTMSSPQVANDQDSGMVLSSEAWACGLLANFWQSTQRRTISSAFFMASRCVLPPFNDFLSDPTMSSPQVANGQDSGLVLSSEAGACGLLANFWQSTQRRTISSAFFMAVGR